MKPTITIFAGVVAAILGYSMWPVEQKTSVIDHVSSAEGAPLAIVILPKNLSPNAQIGKLGFEAKCAACHGRNAAGKDGIAPPLVHKFTEPSHHGDESFQRAVSWAFGDITGVW